MVLLNRVVFVLNLDHAATTKAAHAHDLGRMPQSGFFLLTPGGEDPIPDLDWAHAMRARIRRDACVAGLKLAQVASVVDERGCDRRAARLYAVLTQCCAHIVCSTEAPSYVAAVNARVMLSIAIASCGSSCAAMRAASLTPEETNPRRGIAKWRGATARDRLPPAVTAM